MLQTGAVEPLDQPGPGCYNWLFLVEKVTGDWNSVIELFVLNGFITLTKFRMETVTWFLGSIRLGDRCSPST